jgi:hypothetical protein
MRASIHQKKGPGRMSDSVTVSSTRNWRAWWCEEAVRTGSTLTWQHVSALTALRALCESSGAQP